MGGNFATKKTSDMVLNVVLPGRESLGKIDLFKNLNDILPKNDFFFQISDMLQVTLAAPSTLSMVFFFSEHIVTIFSFVLVSNHDFDI